MSRTHKDRPHRVRFPYRWDHDTITIRERVLVTTSTELDWETMEFVTTDLDEPHERWITRRLETRTTKPKRKKRKDTQDHWMSTPSWWTRLMMNKPQRRRGHVWERKVLLEDIEETDPPDVSHKPHVYYW